MNKSVVLLTVSAFVITLTGCAPPGIRGRFVDTTEMRRNLLTPLNVPITREVGETMYEKGVRVTSNIVTVKTAVSVTSSLDLGHNLNVASGTVGRLLFRSIGGEPSLCFYTSGVGQVVTAIGGLGAQTTACLVDVDKDSAFDVSMFTTREKYFPLSNKVPYEVINTEELDEDVKGALLIDLLYQGSARGVIRLSYREFRDSLARPAFTQDLSYELDADGTATIGFKGMRIKILRATNQNISYIVERPMN